MKMFRAFDYFRGTLTIRAGGGGRHAARTSDHAGPIAYVMNLFPNLTETFVYREVQSLRAGGLDVRTFSIRRPCKEEISQEAHEHLRDTYYILPLALGVLVREHIRTFWAQPRRYLRILRDVLTGSHDRWTDRLRSLCHFAEAVSLIPVMRESRVRHIHAHFAVGSATCAWVLARFLRLPFSFTAHAYDIWQDRLLLSEKLRDAAFVVTCTDYNRRHLMTLTPNHLTTPIYVVYHGVDTQRFVPSARPLHPVPRILAVGQLREQKGFATLLRSCARLRQWGEPFECTIVGDGPLAGSLQALSRELGLADRVHFLGRAFQEQMPDIYASADLFVLPCTRAADNDRDGIPNAMKEAMASGLAVVSTRFSGVPELVGDEGTGLLVAPDDHEALAQAMRRLLGSSDLRCSFGTAGRERVVKEASLVQTAARLAALFDSSTQVLQEVSAPAVEGTLS